MMQASKAFSEKTEAQRKAAMDNKPAEDETVEEGLDKLETEVSEPFVPPCPCTGIHLLLPFSL